MKLTGKCKEDFEKWYTPYIRKNKFVGDRYFDETLINQFYEWNQSMQYGVYVDFFDSVGIEISITPEHYFFEYLVTVSDSEFKQGQIKPKLRSEARQKAIEKANELYNEKYK